MSSLLFYSFILMVSILIALIIPKKKDTSLGIILLVEYFVISLCSIIIVKDNLLGVQDITFFPFVILLSSYFIVFLPFFNNRNNFNADKIEITYYKSYNYMVYLYIIFSVVSITIYLPFVIEQISSNNWATIRQLQYNDLDIKIYGNTIERIALNYVSYFKIFVLLVYFIFLKYDYNPKLRTLLLITIIANNLLASMQNVSRGMILDFFLLFIAMYMFFKSALKKDITRRINIFLVIISSIFFIYSMVVTISRFSSSGDFDLSAMQSLIEYFGQPPLVFNYGVFPIFAHTYGSYSFGKLFELFGANIEFSQSTIGGNWGSGFYTYVGSVYIDFGVIGVIVHAVLIYFILSYLLRKNRFKISAIFLIFTIYEYLLKGAFVISRSYIISLVMNIVIIIFIYVQERIKLNYSRKPFVDLSVYRKKKIKFKW